MANEAVAVEKSIVRPTNRRIGSTGGPKILKGTLLTLGDNNLVSGSLAAWGGAFGGVASADRVSGATIAAHINDNSVWDMKVNASVGVTTGDKVVISGANLIGIADTTQLAAGKGIGIVEEDGAASEVVRVRLTS